jgi:hypothetical protein
LLSSHPDIGFPNGLFPPGFLTKILRAFLICLKCATHCITLYLIPLIIFCHEHRLKSLLTLQCQPLCSAWSLMPHMQSASVHHSILQRAFYGTSNLKPSILGSSWNLNPNATAGLILKLCFQSCPITHLKNSDLLFG